jgi:hypothetical protein
MVNLDFPRFFYRFSSAFVIDSCRFAYSAPMSELRVRRNIFFASRSSILSMNMASIRSVLFLIVLIVSCASADFEFERIVTSCNVDCDEGACE